MKRYRVTFWVPQEVYVMAKDEDEALCDSQIPYDAEDIEIREMDEATLDDMDVAHTDRESAA